MSSAIVGNINTTANLAVGASAAGSLDFNGDTDWWRTSLAAGFGYQIWLWGSSSGLGTLIDPYLALFGSSGSSVAFNDDVSAINRESYLYFAPTITGAYYLSAEEFNNNATGTYRITLRLDQISNVSSMATISPNSMATDRVGWQGDMSDWYRINFIAGVMYQFDLIGSTRDLIRNVHQHARL